MKRGNRIVTLAAIYALAFTACPLAGQTWLGGSFEEALSKAKQTGKILLVDFYVEYG